MAQLLLVSFSPRCVLHNVASSDVYAGQTQWPHVCACCFLLERCRKRQTPHIVESHQQATFFQERETHRGFQLHTCALEMTRLLRMSETYGKQINFLLNSNFWLTAFLASTAVQEAII